MLPALRAAADAGQKTVILNTSDGCRLEAFYLAPSPGSYVFINAHGLGSDKNEWAGFQAGLKTAGYGYLSLDLRGHGASRSCAGKKADYRAFTREDWAAVFRDIQAAAAWLKKKRTPARRLVFCGASVGANLAFKAAMEGPVKPYALVLLSPGLEYAGVNIEAYITSPRPFRLLAVASPDDQYAWQSSHLLVQESVKRSLDAAFVHGGSGHGVNMFRAPTAIPAILSWLSNPASR